MINKSNSKKSPSTTIPINNLKSITETNLSLKIILSINNIHINTHQINYLNHLTLNHSKQQPKLTHNYSKKKLSNLLESISKVLINYLSSNLILNQNYSSKNNHL